MSVTTVSTIHQSVAQTGSHARTSTIAKHALIGGAIGAAAGAGLSFTALPFIGALSAPIAAAIGGVAGLVIGGIVGFLRSRSSDEGARVGAGTLQKAPPLPTSGSGSRPQLPPPLPS